MTSAGKIGEGKSGERTTGASILHLVTDLRIGGTQKLLLERVRRMREFRHHVLVFARHTGSSGGPDLTRAFEEAGAAVHDLGLRSPRQAAGAWLCGRLDDRLGLILTGSRAELIHSTLFHTHLLGERLAARSGLPHVASKEGTDDWMNPLQRMLERRALGRAARVIAVSGAVEGSVRRFGVSRVQVIRNGIDPESPGSWTVPAAPAGNPRLLGIGRLDRVKGWEDLIAALRLLRDRYPEARLDLSGEGDLEASLKKQARSLGIEAMVRFHAPGERAVAAPPAGTGEARPIVVVPSREEGFGLILLEAMARGLPLIASRVGGIPEVVRDGVEGLLVPPREPRLCAEAIARLAADPALAARLGDAGRERAREFPLEEMIRAYRDLYREVLDETARAARIRRRR